MKIAAQDIVSAATSAGVMIATAESCTGGLIIGALTDVPGSSAVVDRGFVTYSNAAKMDMLGVSPDTLANHGAVSEDTAREMADGALARSTAQIAVSVTGIAGPGGGTAFKPEGRVCFGLARIDHPTHVETMDFGALGRDKVRDATVDHALALILSALA